MSPELGRKLCDQQPPSSDDELQARQGQRLALISKTGSIAHGDCMARMLPAVANEILEATRKFCDRVPLTGDVHSESLALVSEVSGICHRDLMRRLIE